MAKVTDKTAITAAESGDFLYIVDVSDTTDDPAGSGKKITSGNFLQAGQPLGLATLDAFGKIPTTQLPASVMEYKGTWNASTNTPTLANGTGDPGDLYRVTVAGTTDFGAGGIAFVVGDYVIYNGTTWERSASSDPIALISQITGNTGVVTPSAGNVNITAGALVDGTASFVASGSSLLLKFTTSGNNLGIGTDVMSNIDTGTAEFNTGFGPRSLAALVDGTQNTGGGYQALFSVVGASGNTMFGYQAGRLIISDGNTGMGRSVFPNLITGTRNVGLGYQTGNAYVSSESGNFLVNSLGQVGDNHVCRIGDGTGTGSNQFNEMFLSGIFGVETPDPFMVTVDQFGQMGFSENLVSSFRYFHITTNTVLTPNAGYFAELASVLTLPISADAPDGAVITVVVEDASAVTIEASLGSGDVIRVGDQVSAADGSVVSTQIGDSITLVNRQNSGIWYATSVIGNWTIA